MILEKLVKLDITANTVRCEVPSCSNRTNIEICSYYRFDYLCPTHYTQLIKELQEWKEQHMDLFSTEDG